MSEKTDYGIINVENKGNTSTFANFFHYGDELPKPNSDGNPHFEGSPEVTPFLKVTEQACIIKKYY